MRYPSAEDGSDVTSRFLRVHSHLVEHDPPVSRLPVRFDNKVGDGFRRGIALGQRNRGEACRVEPILKPPFESHAVDRRKAVARPQARTGCVMQCLVGIVAFDNASSVLGRVFQVEVCESPRDGKIVVLRERDV